jgi:hypothetical protein
MMNRQSMSLIAKSSLIYALAYLIAGGIAYQLITKEFYIGDTPIFTAYLRSEANPTEWVHTNIWLVPGLLLRAILISSAILPFIETLRKMTLPKRVATIFALMFVLTHIAAAAPSPSNIEGLVYMKPQLIGIEPFLLTQPEMILQCLLFALGLSWMTKGSSAGPRAAAATVTASPGR